MESVVLGHHISKSFWTPVIGVQLTGSVEANNPHDGFAVALSVSEIGVVGHVPRKISCTISRFMSHGGMVTCTIMGRRQRGKGLEVPCTYSFNGKKENWHCVFEIYSRENFIA